MPIVTNRKYRERGKRSERIKKKERSVAKKKEKGLAEKQKRSCYGNAPEYTSGLYYTCYLPRYNTITCYLPRYNTITCYLPRYNTMDMEYLSMLHIEDLSTCSSKQTLETFIDERSIQRNRIDHHKKGQVITKKVTESRQKGN